MTSTSFTDDERNEWCQDYTSISRFLVSCQLNAFLVSLSQYQRNLHTKCQNTDFHQNEYSLRPLIIMMLLLFLYLTDIDSVSDFINHVIKVIQGKNTSDDYSCVACQAWCKSKERQEQIIKLFLFCYFIDHR